MKEADIAAVSAIRVAGWQAAYTGMVPQPYLDGMRVEKDAERCRRRFALSGGQVMDLVAVDDHSEVVGWACHGPYRGAEADHALGELYALYVQPSLIGTGVGRTLLNAVNTHAAARGFDTLLLWVFRDNFRARRFYELAGYSTDGAVQVDEYGGALLSEVRYRFTVSDAI
ncbi:GNAT family N-acetyltransferase [Streptomyces sp. NPDC093225]|uniref:GNAT family N-acetyltransferase n=1 Tax=Streptomyces sp. NPDC093225 TaxID=3366034 RepID=UPI0038207A55